VICATGVNQSDGTVLLVLNPSVTDVSTCQYVVQSGSDVAGSLLTMSAQTGGLYAAAMVSVWLIAWSFKALYKTLGVNSNESD
jgi:hypothetical protein